MEQRGSGETVSTQMILRFPVLCGSRRQIVSTITIQWPLKKSTYMHCKIQFSNIFASSLRIKNSLFSFEFSNYNFSRLSNLFYVSRQFHYSWLASVYFELFNRQLYSSSCYFVCLVFKCSIFPALCSKMLSVFHSSELQTAFDAHMKQHLKP